MFSDTNPDIITKGKRKRCSDDERFIFVKVLPYLYCIVVRSLGTKVIKVGYF